MISKIVDNKSRKLIFTLSAVGVVALGLSQEANRDLDFETSRKWADQILNPDVRKALSDQIDERQSVHGEAGQHQMQP